MAVLLAKPALKAYLKRCAPVWLPKSYDPVLVIDDRLTKMAHYEPVKVTLDAPELVEIILDVVVPGKLNRD